MDSDLDLNPDSEKEEDNKDKEKDKFKQVDRLVMCQAALPMTALSRDGLTLFCWSRSGPSL